MPNFNYITVVATYGHNDGTSAIPSIVKSIQELPGSRGLLLSLSRPNALPPEIDWKPIMPMNHWQYSLFMMFNLHNFIATEFALVVQDDGWILSGENWNDRFLEYDYIGALSHLAIVEDMFYPAFSWVNLENPRIIQNGGFSLRSKKFLETPSHTGANYYFSNHEILKNEDVQLSGIYKLQLEQLGIKFAPPEISNLFSLEYVIPVMHDNLDFKVLFGTHGDSRQLLSDHTILLKEPVENLSKRYREIEYLQFLETKGYKIVLKL